MERQNFHVSKFVSLYSKPNYYILTIEFRKLLIVFSALNSHRHHFQHIERFGYQLWRGEFS